VSGGLGQGLEIFNTINSDALWYALTTSLGRATTLTGTMVFDDDYISTENLNRIQSNIPSSFAGTPYSLATSIAETATHKQTFQPSKYMIRGFQIYVTAKGSTADWTLTLHDADNVSVGTSTVTNANLTNSAYNNFYFSSPLELVPGASYHYHLTASNTTGTPTAGTGTNNDLEDGAYYLIVPSLVTDSYYHPMKEFTNLLCIGNGRFLATIDDSEVFDPERLVFAKGEAVRTLEVVGDYIAIFTWKYNDITKVTSSKMYLWDGVSPTYNNIIPIKDGQVNAVTTMGNELYLINGTQGQISAWNGNITPIRRLNDVGENKTIEILPGAMTVWNSQIYFGIGGGTSTSCPRVIYTYGTRNKDYPASLNKAHPTSSDSVVDIADKKDNNDVQVGAVIGIDATTFLSSWKNGSTYGVDKQVITKDQNQVYMTTMRIDGDKPYILKELEKVIITHSPLRTEDGISVEVRINNNGDFKSLFKNDGDEHKDSVTKTFVTSGVMNFLELEFRVWLYGVDDLPDFYTLTLQYADGSTIRTDSVKAISL